jgi:hypothetical protein
MYRLLFWVAEECLGLIDDFSMQPLWSQMCQLGHWMLNMGRTVSTEWSMDALAGNNSMTCSYAETGRNASEDAGPGLLTVPLILALHNTMMER